MRMSFQKSGRTGHRTPTVDHERYQISSRWKDTHYFLQKRRITTSHHRPNATSSNGKQSIIHPSGQDYEPSRSSIVLHFTWCQQLDNVPSQEFAGGHFRHGASVHLCSSYVWCANLSLPILTDSRHTYLQLVPICPTFLLTLQASNDSTDVASSTSHPTSAPVVSHSRKSWQDYLKENSKSQTMDGNEDEMKRSEQRYKNMEMYFKR